MYSATSSRTISADFSDSTCIGAPAFVLDCGDSFFSGEQAGLGFLLSAFNQLGQNSFSDEITLNINGQKVRALAAVSGEIGQGCGDIFRQMEGYARHLDLVGGST